MSDNMQNRQGPPLSSSIHNEQSSAGGNVGDTAARTNSEALAGEMPPPQVQDEVVDRTNYQQVSGSSAVDEATTGGDSGSTVVEGIDQWVNGDPSYGKQFLPDQQAPGTTGVGNVGELPQD